MTLGSSEMKYYESWHPVRAFVGSMSAGARIWHESPAVLRVCCLVFELSLAVFAIMVTIYYQAFAQNKGCTLALPFGQLNKVMIDRVTLDTLRSEARSQGQRTYLFVLDCSASIDDAFLGPPNWYGSAVAGLRRKRYEFNSGAQPTAHSVSRVALYSLLDALVDSVEDRPAGLTTDRFAVWDVCGGSMKKVPRVGKSEPIDRPHVDDAIGRVEAEVRPPVGAQLRTSFLELFEGLDGVYGVYDHYNESQDRSRAFVITIISDFEDDPDGLGTREDAFAGKDRERQRMFLERERELARATRNLSADNVTINLVAISHAVGRDTGIVGFVRRNLRWYRYSKVDIMSDIVAGEARLLYPVELVERRMRLWYSDPLSVQGGVQLQVEKGEDVDVALPAEGAVDDSFELLVGTLIDGHPPRIVCHLRSGEQISIKGLSPGEWILMRYTGVVRSRAEVVRIFDHSAYRAYLVPIEFVRRLPSAVALHMAILILMMCAPLAVLVLLGVFGRLNYGSRS